MQCDEMDALLFVVFTCQIHHSLRVWLMLPPPTSHMGDNLASVDLVNVEAHLGPA